MDRPMVSQFAIAWSFSWPAMPLADTCWPAVRTRLGTADGGPGLPFVNWSIIAGDLRIAHFIAIHAIQIVPLFAYILSQMAPIPAVKHRRIAVAALAIVVSTPWEQRSFRQLWDGRLIPLGSLKLSTEMTLRKAASRAQRLESVRSRRKEQHVHRQICRQGLSLDTELSSN